MSSDLHAKRLSSSPSPASLAERDEGIVLHVDTVGREVCLLLSTGAAVIDVPLDCPIVLRGERVKLRLLQTGDQVRITYMRKRGLNLCQFLEVQPRDC